jgi:hypothetical protein
MRRRIHVQGLPQQVERVSSRTSTANIRGAPIFSGAGPDVPTSAIGPRPVASVARRHRPRTKQRGLRETQPGRLSRSHGQRQQRSDCCRPASRCERQMSLLCRRWPCGAGRPSDAPRGPGAAGFQAVPRRALSGPTATESLGHRLPQMQLPVPNGRGPASRESSET